MPRTRVEAAALTVPRAGGLHEENEDSHQYRVGDGASTDWADFVAVVADGVGSSREPRAASAAATQTWVQFLERRFRERPGDLATFDEAQFSHLMRECFAQAHRQVEKQAPNGAATAAGVCVQGDWLLAATVGDARVYRYSAGRLEQLTEDQVDAAGDPTDVLGGRAAPPAAEGYARRILRPEDWIVACSDGLAKSFAPDELADLIHSCRTPEEAVKAAFQRVFEIKVPDDVTVVFARIVEVGAPFWAAGRDGVEPVAGSPVAGSPVAGSPVAGSPVAGSPVAGSPVAGSPVAGSPVAGSPAARGERRSTRADRPVTQAPREGPVKLNPAESGLSDLDKRITRLERSSGNGALSQQDQAKLEREFGRLEQEIAGVQAQVTLASRVPAAVAAAALGVGLLIGLVLPAPWRATGGSGDAAAGDRADARFVPQPPDDLLVPLEDRPTDRSLVLRYRSTDQKRKVAIYRYEDGGKPSLIYTIPSGGDASARSRSGTTGGADPGSAP